MEFFLKHQPKREIKISQVSRSSQETVSGGVIVEQPVSISVNGSIWVTLMSTPLDLEALAVGFLFNQEIINSFKEVIHIELHPNSHMVEILLNKDVEKPTKWLITSGCSGGVTKDNQKLSTITDRPDNGWILKVDQIISLARKLIEHEGLHQQVGGVHTSALSDGDEICVLCEDIGRHNSIDKVAGKILINTLQIDRKIILTTGRISSDMLQKAIRMGASVLISLSSPTSLSIEMADKAGITLIGYARGRKFNIYTHAERILFPKKMESIEE
jgi:FdhD protein